MKKQHSYRPWETSSWDGDATIEKYQDEEGYLSDEEEYFSEMVPKIKEVVGAAYYEDEKKEGEATAAPYEGKSYESFQEV